MKSVWGSCRAVGCRCPPLPSLPSFLGPETPGCGLFLMSAADTRGGSLKAIFIRSPLKIPQGRCAKKHLLEPNSCGGKSLLPPRPPCLLCPNGLCRPVLHGGLMSGNKQAAQGKDQGRCPAPALLPERQTSRHPQHCPKWAPFRTELQASRHPQH